MAGLAIIRCAEHERADDIDITARAVLAAMGSFVGGDDANQRRPLCVAAQETIAKRAGCGISTVARAQGRLAAMGVIEYAGRTGAGLKATKRWRLTLLAARDPGEPTGSGSTGHTVGTVAALVGQSDRQGNGTRPDGGYVNLTDKQPVKLTDKQPVNLTDNPFDSQRPPGSAGGGGSDVAAAPPLPGGRGVAAPSSNGQVAGPLGIVMAGLGYSQTAAERYIEQKTSGRDVRNLTAWITRCVERDKAEPAPRKPAEPLADSKTAPAARTAARGSAGRSQRAKPGPHGVQPPLGLAAHRRSVAQVRNMIEDGFSRSQALSWVGEQNDHDPGSLAESLDNHLAAEQSPVSGARVRAENAKEMRAARTAASEAPRAQKRPSATKGAKPKRKRPVGQRAWGSVPTNEKFAMAAEVKTLREQGMTKVNACAQVAAEAKVSPTMLGEWCGGSTRGTRVSMITARHVDHYPPASHPGVPAHGGGG